MNRKRVTSTLAVLVAVGLLAACAVPFLPEAAPTVPAGEPLEEEDALLPTLAAVTPEPTSPPFVFPTPSHSETNILVVGTDRRSASDPTWRTDTIMWVTIRRNPDQIGIISVPRDLWLDIPKVGKNRVNVADYYGEKLKYEGGGPGLLADTLKNNLGLRVDHYVRVDFEAFEKVIDAMGGITVDVECPISDNFLDSTAPNGFRLLDVQAGRQHMDGKTALMFARSRHGTSDLSRAGRQQRVMMGIREQVTKANVLPKIPQLWASVSKSVKTDLSLADILSLALFTTQLDKANIKGMVIDYTMTTDWTTPQGAMVLLPNIEKIRQAIGGLFDRPPLLESGNGADGQTKCP